jgi:trimethylamine--corrinoid protein Co-methyltransferase
VKGGQYKILSRGEVQTAHEAVLQILEETGVKVSHESSLRLLDDAGAEVDYTTKIVKMPSSLVEECIQKAPERVRISGRNPENDLMLKGRNAFFGMGSGTTYVIDLDTGEPRPGWKRDVANAARLGDALPYIDFIMGFCFPSDVPTETVGLHEAEAMVKNTEKPMLLYGYHGKDVTNDIIEVGSRVQGGLDRLKKRPLFALYLEPASPLLFEEEYLDALLAFVQAGLPVIWTSGPGVGATSPITMAGTAIQATAESLGGNVIAQLTNPGTPFICGGCSLIFDMRTMIYSYGAAEKAIADCIIAQLAHYHRIPMFGTGGVTDSKIVDGQAVGEAAESMLLAAMAGQNLIHDIGYIDSGGTASYEMIVICDELAARTSRVLRRTQLSPETLAVNAIKEAGPEGNFLELDHTREWFRKEHLLTDLFNRQPREKWRRAGAKPLSEQARERAKEIINTHRPTLIPRDIQQQITQIIKETEKREQT